MKYPREVIIRNGTTEAIRGVQLQEDRYLDRLTDPKVHAKIKRYQQWQRGVVEWVWLVSGALSLLSVGLAWLAGKMQLDALRLVALVATGVFGIIMLSMLPVLSRMNDAITEHDRLFKLFKTEQRDTFTCIS